MASLDITIKSRLKRPQKILVEMNVDRFERLAAGLGFFSSDFLKSLGKAEKDYQNGRIKKIKSLRELRK
ncbi:hypothetical protein KKG58_02315 [Patescibacteria group bacterium]|nr:hypothetical protein [Patescibacteria group bacterium]